MEIFATRSGMSSIFSFRPRILALKHDGTIPSRKKSCFASSYGRCCVQIQTHSCKIVRLSVNTFSVTCPLQHLINKQEHVKNIKTLILRSLDTELQGALETAYDNSVTKNRNERKYCNGKNHEHW